MTDENLCEYCDRIMQAERDIDKYIGLGIPKILKMDQETCEVHEGINAMIIQIKIPCKVFCDKVDCN